MIGITILGADAAQAYLERIGAAARDAHGVLARAGSGEPYGWGIEFGQRRNGRLARRAGGAFMLTTAFRQVFPRIAPALAAALGRGGPRAVRVEALALATEIANEAKPLTPAVSGNLRRSMHAESAG